MRTTIQSLRTNSESLLVEGAEAFLDFSDNLTARVTSLFSRRAQRKPADFRELFAPFLESGADSHTIPADWARSLLDRDELNLIETNGGYRARLRQISVYLQFASRIRKSVFAARRLTLLNLDTGSLSLDRVLRRDRELAKCLFLVYAAVPMAALNLGQPSQLLARSVATLQDLVGIGMAAPVANFA